MEWVAIVGLCFTAVSVITAVKAWLNNNTISRDHAKLSERVVTLESTIHQTTKSLSELNNQVHTLATSLGAVNSMSQRHIDCLTERNRREGDYELRLRHLEGDDAIEKLQAQVIALAGQLDVLRGATLNDRANAERVAENVVYRILDTRKN